MPIEEKPQLLEFNCTIEGMEGVEWNIKYDPNDKIAPLNISGNGQNFYCPVELFGDVTAFLQSKNIIKPNILTRSKTAQTPGLEPGTFASSLMPPKIEGQGDTPTVVNNVASGPPMDALASFDITDDSSNIAPPVVNNTVVENSPETIKTPVPVKTAGTVVTPNTKSEVINRPVIRTRVNNDDPQSAEKEAALIRGSGAAGAKKTIKKRHQVSG